MTKKVSEIAIAKALREAAGIKAYAAKKLGIARSSLQERVERSKKLQKVIADIEEESLDAAEGVIHQHLRGDEKAGIKPDPVTARWYAERKGKKRGYGNSVQNSIDEQQLEAFVAALGGDPDKLRAALSAFGVTPD